MKKLLTLCISLCWLTSLFGQGKYEKEYRIAEAKVPQLALSYVAGFDFEKKVKWYREENLNTASIEAKTKHQKQGYSIEFDTTGQLQDIEIKIDFQQMNTSAQKRICEALNKEFDRYKIDKIQKQYTGPATTIQTYIKQMPPVRPADILLQYEIILEGKKEKTIRLYEYTFTEQGQLVGKSRILLRNTDILEY